MRHLTRLVPLAIVAMVGAALSAQQQPVPQPWQPGKDVVWVPSPVPVVEKMLDLARVTPGDYVIDLGSGDGRTVIAAAARGARAVGIEYDGPLVELSRRRAAEAHAANATFVQGDLFDADLTPATVVTMFLLTEINLKLRPRLLELTPGTRVVSNTFTMGDWPADEQATVQDGCTSWCTVLLWIVPARAEGTFRSADGAFTLRQHFQMLDGTFTAPDGTSAPVSGKMRGARIVLSDNGVVYDGRVLGDAIEGTVTAGGLTHAWHATRGAP